MQPVQITIRDLPNSQAIESHLRKKAEKLNHYCQKINSCRIVLTIPQKHKHQGKLYCVHIDLTVPGKELVVNRHLDEDVYVAIRDAFNAIIRQLDSYERKRKGHVKTHNGLNRGYVAKIFADEGYGFIQGMDGDEFYFSMSNVTYPSFEQLELGDIVEYIGIPSTEGFQANRITKVKEHEWSLDDL